jgi:hypothetical protein
VSTPVLSFPPIAVLAPRKTPEEEHRKAIAYVEGLIAQYERELLETPADSDRHIARRAVRELLISDWCKTLHRMTRNHQS